MDFIRDIWENNNSENDELNGTSDISAQDDGSGHRMCRAWGGRLGTWDMSGIE